MRDSHKRFRNGHSWHDKPVSQEREPDPAHVSRVPLGAKVWSTQEWGPDEENLEYLGEELNEAQLAKIAAIVADSAARRAELDEAERAFCYWSPNRGGIGGEWVRDPLKTTGIDQSPPTALSTNWTDKTSHRVKWGKTKRLVP